MRVNCVRHAFDKTTKVKALERAAALGAVLENLRISQNRKCYATLLEYPKDTVILPWEELGGKNPHVQLTKLFAGEVWDGRQIVGGKLFLPPDRHDRIQCAIRDFVEKHTASVADTDKPCLLNALLSFRSLKRGRDK